MKNKFKVLINKAQIEMAIALEKEMNKAIKHMNKTNKPVHFTIPRKPFINLLNRARKKEYE